MKITHNMSLILLIIFSLWRLGSCQSNDQLEGMTYIGTAAVAYTLCPENGLFYMSRESGRPPATENYWDGSIYLIDLTNSSEADIELTLDNPAVVTSLPKISNKTNVGRIRANGTTFQMKILNTSIAAPFTVQGFQGMGYPNVLKVTLNGEQICKDPKKIEPFLEGSVPVAFSGFEIDSDNFESNCGRPERDHTELILNSKETKPGDWPWHVALYSINANDKSTKAYKCGGSIISYKSIVTAAHCVTGSNGLSISVDQLLVIAGKYSLNERDTSAQELSVRKILVNGEYNPNTLENDIAIIKLKVKIHFNQFIQPICLWNDFISNRSTAKELIYGLNGTIIGWGLDENETSSQKLSSSEMTIISDINCVSNFPEFFQRFVNTRSFCAGNLYKSNPCNGDSGGGLAMAIRQPDNKLSYFLRGITSVTVSQPNENGEKVCDPNYYTVFTDAAQYKDWLLANLYEA